jgi:hypothetical protein
MSTNRILAITFLSLSIPTVSTAQLPPPASWLNCIAQRGPRTCVLDIGTYSVDQTLDVAKDVTIQGGSLYPWQTILKRSQWSATNRPYEPILSTFVCTPGPDCLPDNPYYPGGSVSIQNMGFDGSRPFYTNWDERDGYWYGPWWYSPMNGCKGGNYFTTDVVGWRSTYIYNTYHIGGPGTAIDLEADGYVANATVAFPRSTGVVLRGGSNMYYTSVVFSGTAGIAIHGVSQQGFQRFVWGNTLTYNRYEQSDSVFVSTGGGGQLYLDPSAGNVVVGENVVDGVNYKTTPGQIINGCFAPNSVEAPFGLEVDGSTNGVRATNLRLYNNEIKRNPGGGMTIWGSQMMVISGNNPNCPYPSCSYKYIHSNVSSPPVYGVPPRGIEIQPVRVYGVPVSVNADLTLDSVRSVCNSGFATLLEPTTSSMAYFDPRDQNRQGGYISTANPAGHCLKLRPPGGVPYFPSSWPLPSGPNPTPGSIESSCLFPPLDIYTCPPQ